jgi:hypothetical protein
MWNAPWPQEAYHHPGVGRCSSAGPGAAPVHCDPARPAVGCRPDPCADLGRLDVRRVRAGPVQPPYRELAAGLAPAHRAAPGRPGDDHLGPAGRPRCAGSPEQCRLPVHQLPLHQPAGRGQRGALDRFGRRQLRHRHGRVADRDVQGRADRQRWRTRDEVEYAVVELVAWYNTRRLHSSIGDIPPAEFETNYYASAKACNLPKPQPGACLAPPSVGTCWEQPRRGARGTMGTSRHSQGRGSAGSNSVLGTWQLGVGSAASGDR